MKNLFSSKCHQKESPLPPRPKVRSHVISTILTRLRIAKAAAAKKAALKGTHGQVKRKVRTTTTFRRPKTLRLARAAKYPRKAVPHAPRLDQYSILKFPLNSESAMRKMENHNTLVFITDVKATKKQIKMALKKMYDVDAIKINTLIRPVGDKKAYIRLAADQEAMEVASKIGFI